MLQASAVASTFASTFARARTEPVEVDPAAAHADVIASRLAAMMLDTARSLIEPVAPSRDRALIVIGKLVDTLAGFALGAALAVVLDGIRAATGSDDRPAIRRAITAACQRPDPCARAGLPAVVRSVIDDPEDRPLVDELATRLHHRLLAGSAQLARAIGYLIAAVPAEDLPAVEHRLRELAGHDLAALRFSEQMCHGWRTYAAALGTGSMPDIEHDRSRALWREWLRRIRRERKVFEEPSAQALGYIMRVA